jgi:hypothetical protein
MPTTASRYPDAWHHAEEDQERAWLDDWMRGLVCPVTLVVCSRTEPTSAVQSLAAGRHQ